MTAHELGPRPRPDTRQLLLAVATPFLRFRECSPLTLVPRFRCRGSAIARLAAINARQYPEQYERTVKMYVFEEEVSSLSVSPSLFPPALFGIQLCHSC